jgi:hypothetical protein
MEINNKGKREYTHNYKKVGKAIDANLSKEEAQQWKSGEIPLIFHSCHTDKDVGYGGPGFAQNFSSEFSNAIVIAPDSYEVINSDGSRDGLFYGVNEAANEGMKAKPSGSNPDVSTTPGKWRAFQNGKEIDLNKVLNQKNIKL